MLLRSGQAWKTMGRALIICHSHKASTRVRLSAIIYQGFKMRPWLNEASGTRRALAICELSLASSAATSPLKYLEGARGVSQNMPVIYHEYHKNKIPVFKRDMGRVSEALFIDDAIPRRYIERVDAIIEVLILEC